MSSSPAAAAGSAERTSSAKGKNLVIAVVDYHKGNLKSVERGLAAAGANVRITDDASAIARADAIVLPGVGAFADAAATMRELGQMDVIRERIAAGVPFLGICLGMHLMFEEGEEGAEPAADGGDPVRPKGLAVLPGVVAKLPRLDTQGRAYKIPHVGWNSIVPASSGFDCALFDGIAPGEFFYFTHSYAAPDTPASVALTEHATVFPCAVRYGDVAFGVQFHPEKSSDAGAALLRNFARIAGEV